RPQRRLGSDVRNEYRLTRLEGALELRVAIEIDDEVADRRVLVASDEPHFVGVAGEEDRAAVQLERLAHLPRDRLEDVDEVERGRDVLQDVDDGEQMVALALQLGDPRPKVGAVGAGYVAVNAPIGPRRRRREGVLTGWGRVRRLGWVRVIHRPPQDARCIR